MQRWIFYAATITSCLVCFCVPAIADWITLKDGVQIHGKIVRKTDKEVALKSAGGGILTFRRHQIAEIHELNADPETDRAEERRPVWLREAAVGRDLFRRIFGKATLVIPRSCQKILGRGEYPGHDGEVLGLYEHEKDSVTVCVTHGEFPLGAKSFADLRTRIIKSLVKRKRRVLKFEKQKFDKLDGYYSETEESVGDTKLIHVEAWIRVSDDAVYMLHVTVPHGIWTSDPYRFRGVVRSFEYHSEAPEQRSL